MTLINAGKGTVFHRENHIFLQYPSILECTTFHNIIFYTEIIT